MASWMPVVYRKIQVVIKCYSQHPGFCLSFIFIGVIRKFVEFWNRIDNGNDYRSQFVKRAWLYMNGCLLGLHEYLFISSVMSHLLRNVALSSEQGSTKGFWFACGHYFVLFTLRPLRAHYVVWLKKASTLLVEQRAYSRQDGRSA